LRENEKEIFCCCKEGGACELRKVPIKDDRHEELKYGYCTSESVDDDDKNFFFRFIFFLQEKDCIFPAITDLFIVRITNLLFEMEITLESFQIKHIFFKTSSFKTFLFILDI
jgi:hypothetical protein